MTVPEVNLVILFLGGMISGWGVRGLYDSLLEKARRTNTRK